MANIVKAFEALQDEKKVSWHARKARLSAGVMVWDNGDSILFNPLVIRHWEIEEPEPEKGYIDCPVFKDGDRHVFEYKKILFYLYKAPTFDLIGYVYANGEIRNVPTLCHGRYCAERCVAVRIAKGE